jgi:hypothetical protein
MRRLASSYFRLARTVAIPEKSVYTMRKEGKIAGGVGFAFL